MRVLKPQYRPNQRVCLPQQLLNAWLIIMMTGYVYIMISLHGETFALDNFKQSIVYKHLSSTKRNMWNKWKGAIVLENSLGLKVFFN